MVFGFGKKEQIIEKEVIKEVYRTPEKKKAQKIGIIVGSTREGRVSPQVADYVLQTARAHSDRSFEIIDIKDYDLPFMGTGERVAYIANGTSGVFKEASAEALRQTYTDLLSKGYVMRSREEAPVGSYTVMPDGAGVHGSDLVCQSIACYVDEGDSTVAAIEKTLTKLTGEVIGLVLNREEPDRISYGRINFPMFVGFADHGAYLSSTPHAFPEDVRSYKALNVISCGEVYADRLVEKPFAKSIPITETTPVHYRDCYDALCKAISQKKMTCEEIDEVLLDIMGRTLCSRSWLRMASTAP